MRQWARSTLVQILVCCLIGAKPLPERSLNAHFLSIRPIEQTSGIFFLNSNISIHKKAFENFVWEMVAILSGGGGGVNDRNFYFSAMWPGNVPLVPRHEQVTDYRRCYDIPASKGELFVTLKLNPLPAYDCISAMDVSLNISDTDSCSHYMMYKVSDTVIYGNTITMADCIQTVEELGELHLYCQYRCEPAVNLVFGWSGSSRLQHGMTMCDLRWNYETCWRIVTGQRYSPDTMWTVCRAEHGNRFFLMIHLICVINDTSG